MCGLEGVEEGAWKLAGLLATGGFAAGGGGSWRPVRKSRALCALGGIRVRRFTFSFEDPSELPTGTSAAPSSSSDESSLSHALWVADLEAGNCFCWWLRLSSASRIRASNRASELNFSSPGMVVSEPGMYLIWNARSRMVSRGAGGELPATCWAPELTLPRPRTGELTAEDRPCADVQPSINSLC